MGLGGTPHLTLVPLPAEDVSSEYLRGVWLGRSIHEGIFAIMTTMTKSIVWLGCKVVQIHMVSCVLQRQAATCTVYLPSWMQGRLYCLYMKFLRQS